MTGPREFAGSNRPDLEGLPDAVICVDSRRRVVAVNQAAAHLTGYGPDQMVGRDAEELLTPRTEHGAALWNGGWHRSANLRSVSTIPEHEVRLRCADGEETQVLVTGRYERNGDGTVVGAVVVMRDAARRRNGEVRGIEVISTVSHELRAPLTSVKGYTSLLLNRWEQLGDEQKKMMLEQVHHDADRVTRLVGELLDISRLESGRLVLRRQLIDLPALVNEVMANVAMMETELEAVVEFAEDFPRVYADKDKLEQVLTNLVENAAKYAQPKGMRVVGEVGEGEVSVSVSDVGDGIPPSDLHRVFNKFFRRTETRPSGSGLGLWISRGLVEAHDGRLVVESVMGQGSTFRFTLPLTKPL